MRESDEHGHPMVIVRGDRTHFTRGLEWFTSMPSGEVISGLLPDPDFVEPKEDFNETRVEGFKRSLFHFKVLHEGWEMDNDAWVVELEDGTRAIVTTSHGGTYVAELSAFEQKLAEYEKVASDTRKAIAILKAPPPTVPHRE